MTDDEARNKYKASRQAAGKNATKRFWKPGTYQGWKSYDTSREMNFGQYIGEEYGADPGAERTKKTLQDAHDNLIKELEGKGIPTKTDENIVAMTEYLEGIFFGKRADNEKIDQYQNFTNAVLKAIEQRFNLKIKSSDPSNFWSSDLSIDSASMKKYIDLRTKLSSSSKEAAQRENAAWATILRKLSDINSFEDIVKESPNQEMVKKFNKLKKKRNSDFYDVDSAIKIIQSLYTQTKEGWGETEAIEDSFKRVVNIDRLKKTNFSESEVRAAIKRINSFYEQAKRMFILPPDLFGLAFEMANAFLADATIDPATVEAFTEEQIERAVSESVSPGRYFTDRGGSLYSQDKLNISLMFEPEKVKIENSSKKSGYDEFFVVKNTTESESYGNVLIKTTKVGRSLNTGQEKYAKADVIVNLPQTQGKQGAESRTLDNASLKNWGIVDNSDKHILGATSVLGGFRSEMVKANVKDRHKTLINYIYTVQHPLEGEVCPPSPEPSSRHPVAKEALDNAHRIAKEYLMADIALGLSQKSKFANLLIILDRSRKRIIIIDLVKELGEYLRSNGQSSSNLVLSGYNEEIIEGEARTIRNRARSLSYKKRDDNYLQTMIAYLDSNKASILLNQRLMSFPKN